ncbi:helix-turn-helix domain-containing protein [Acetobacteraceae bacterium KSS8]|uniref:Helix-turn-helix domain-containing protein n=1 Tax=Endosaccharibacter trunci TaxID=2812733 RepID=A0ABT1WB56_9PROT|nr:helix-turn-helix domain-containing protein [Acetobacteraceae bacterium KSS8]
MTTAKDQDANRQLPAKLGPDFSEALSRGLQVMSVFSTSLRPMSLSDLARAVDLPRATVRRSLNTLVHLGYLEEEGRLFRPTPKVLELAHAYLVSNAVSTVLQTTCDRLVRSTGQSCSAAVLDGSDIVMIARSVPAQVIAAGAGIGFRLPAARTALGRVLLSAMPDDQLDRALRAMRLEPPIDPVGLKAILSGVRTAGFSYVDQEAEAGFSSIAVSVQRFDGMTVASLNIGGPSNRLSREVAVHEYLPLLRNASQQLCRQIV